MDGSLAAASGGRHVQLMSKDVTYHDPNLSSAPLTPILHGRGETSGPFLRLITEIRSHPGEQSMDPPAKAVGRVAHRSAKRSRKNLSGAKWSSAREDVFTTKSGQFTLDEF